MFKQAFMALSLLLGGLALLVGLPMPRGHAGEHWPGWRGPTGMGQSDEPDLLLTWGGRPLTCARLLLNGPLPSVADGKPEELRVLRGVETVTLLLPPGSIETFPSFLETRAAPPAK